MVVDLELQVVVAYILDQEDIWKWARSKEEQVAYLVVEVGE